MPLPLVRIRAGLFVEPLMWAIEKAMEFLTEAVEVAALGVEHGFLYCIWDEQYGHLGKATPTNLACLYAQIQYCNDKTRWYPPWSMFVERRELVKEAVLGNSHAVAIVAMYAFQDDAIFKKKLSTNFRRPGPCHCDRLGRCLYPGIPT
jgi:hypothetical protein